MITEHEKAVTDAGLALLAAIEAARAGGYRVDFPDYALRNLAVSETKAVDTNLTFSVATAPARPAALVTGEPLAGTGEAVQLPPVDGSAPAPPVLRAHEPEKPAEPEKPPMPVSSRRSSPPPPDAA